MLDEPHFANGSDINGKVMGISETQSLLSSTCYNGKVNGTDKA